LAPIFARISALRFPSISVVDGYWKTYLWSLASVSASVFAVGVNTITFSALATSDAASDVAEVAGPMMTLRPLS